MACMLRSIFFIGAIYAVSPVKTEMGGMTRADRSRGAPASSELARLTGESAAIALQAARSWAALDEASKAELRRLIGEAIAPRHERAPMRMAGERPRE